MADQTRAKLLDLIKDQGEVVRKLKTAKADSAKGLGDPLDIYSELAALNREFGDVSYVCDWVPTSKDLELYNVCKEYSVVDQLADLPHLKRWLDNIESYSDRERLAFPPPKAINSPSSSFIVEILRRLNKTNSRIDAKTIDEKVRLLANAGWAATDSFAILEESKSN